MAGSAQYDPKATNYASLAQAVATSHADCVLISALTQDNAVALTDQVAPALPAAKLFATAGLAEPAYVDPGAAAGSRRRRRAADDHRADARRRAPIRRPDAAFLAAYARRFGGWQPDAIYGYEAMSLMLDAISRATEHGTDGGRALAGDAGDLRHP